MNKLFTFGRNVKVRQKNTPIEFDQLCSWLKNPPPTYAEHILKTNQKIKELYIEAFNELRLIDYPKGYKGERTNDFKPFKSKHIDELKESLFFFLFGGFGPEHHENTTLQSNGCIQIDIDFKEFEGNLKAQQAKEKLSSDPFIKLLGISPSGFGVKGIIQTDNFNVEQYTQAQDQVAKYIYDKYGYEIDQLSASIPCFWFVDKELYVNKKAEVFKISIEKKAAKEVKPDVETTAFETSFQEFIKECQYQEADWNEWYVLGYAIANKFGENGFDYFNAISEKSSKYTLRKTLKTWNSILKSIASHEGREKQAGFTTIYNFAKNVCGYEIKVKMPETHTPPAKQPIPVTIGTSMNDALKAAQSLPKMKRMFSTLLLENTLNIWGGDNGVGKSIATFALAEHLARGWSFLGFENECEPAKILLYDFELTLQGLLKRYSNSELKNPYQFSSNLYRYDFNPDYSDFSKNYDDQLFADIRANVLKLDAKVLIIDNLSALKSKSNSDGDIALDLMNRLNRLKKELSVTIIVLTHITKHPLGLPIEKNHIAGSKHIQNLCDSIVAIGASCQGDNKIYFKELKNRYEQQVYGPDNIIVCERIKKDNFLTIDFQEFDVESNHLVRETERTNDDPKAKAIRLKEEGKSIGFIASELKKSKSTIHEWTKNVRSTENTKQTERTNAQGEPTDEATKDTSSTNPVRSPNEQPNGKAAYSYEEVKELAHCVLKEYTGREKIKLIQAIRHTKDIDESHAESLFNSMITYELINNTETGYYYLTESVPY